MLKSDKSTQSKSSRSFAQEMQQAFVDWVKNLPFMKREILRDHEREGLESESSDQASVPHPTDGELTERRLENKGKH